MSAETEGPKGFLGLLEIPTRSVQANPDNPRLIFPQEELDRLAESIDLEGILVPVVVFENDDGGYTLIDGERRYHCAVRLGLETLPALITDPKSPRENLVQMFNIHLVREPWRDMPTAWALGRLVEELAADSGPVTDSDLSNLTGLSRERIQRLRHALELPNEYQRYIHEGTIPLNWFWELKRNVIDPLGRRRQSLMNEYGEDRVQQAFVDKRLSGVVTDTVSLRDVRPIINYAADDAADDPRGESVLDETIRRLIEDPDLGIDEAYEDTVQIMVEADKLARRKDNLIKSFQRLMAKTRTAEERYNVVGIGRDLISELEEVLSGHDSESRANR